MPDFKLAYLADQGPWIIDKIGLVDDRHDNSFYQLATGHYATEIDIYFDAITFFSPIQFEKAESTEEYLSNMFLDALDHYEHDGVTLQPVPNSEIASEIPEPTIWIEEGNNIITVEYNNEEIHIPDTMWIYESIPFSNEIKTVTELRKKLKEITGEDIYGIQVPS